MNSRYFYFLPIVSLVIGITSSCSRDPNLLKSKYLASGKIYAEKGEYHEAVIQFKNAIQIDERSAEGHYQLATCYLKLSLWKEAYTELNNTVGIDPQNSKAQIDIGNLLLADRDYDKVREKANLVLSREPGNPDAHALLAHMEAALGRKDSSLTEMNRAIELAPNAWEYYLEIGKLQADAQQMSLAEVSFKKAISLAPRSTVAVMALGDFYAQHGHWEEGEQQFRRAIEIDPNSPEPRATIARFYLFRGQKDKAEEVLKQMGLTLKGNPDAFRMLADLYISTGDLVKAVSEYALLYQEHPKDLQVKKNYAQVLILTSRLDEADKLTDEILKQGANDADGFILRGEILIHRGRTNDAVSAFQSALESQPDNASAHYYLGVAFADLAKDSLAETELRAAVRLRPTMVEAQEALAALALLKRDMQMLAGCGEALITIKPFSFTGYLYRGIARMSHNDTIGAGADFSKIVEMAPQNPIGYLRLAGLRYAQRRYKEAEGLYEKSLAHDPNFTLALMGLIEIYQQEKQPARALARVNEQIAKAPINSAYFMLLGQLLAGHKNFEKAEAALQKAVELDRNNLDAFLALGRIQSSQGSLDKASESYQRAIRENPRDARALVLLASIKDTQGNWQEAEKLYKQALQVEPDYAIAANNLAYLMLEHDGNVDVALSLAQVAEHALPGVPNVVGTLGWAYYRKGSLKIAIYLLEDAVSKAPNDPIFHLHLGLAYLKSNDRRRAKQHLERALHANPKFVQGDAVRKALTEVNGS